MIELFLRPSMRKNPHSWLHVYVDAGFDVDSLRVTEMGESLSERRLGPIKFTVSKLWRVIDVGVLPEWMRG